MQVGQPLGWERDKQEERQADMWMICIILAIRTRIAKDVVGIPPG